MPAAPCDRGCGLLSFRVRPGSPLRAYVGRRGAAATPWRHSRALICARCAAPLPHRSRQTRGEHSALLQAGALRRYVHPPCPGCRADDRRRAGHGCRPRRALLLGSACRGWRPRYAPRSHLLGHPSCPWPPWRSRRRRQRARRRQTCQARRPARRVRLPPLRRRRAASRRGERRNGGLRSHHDLP